MQSTGNSRTTLQRALAAVVCTAMVTITSGVLAEESQEFIMKGNEATASDREWKDNATVPAGMKIILIYGSPKQEGPYIFRAKVPAGYKLPAHKHPDQRIVTVLQGNYWSGAGEKFEQDKLTKYTPGSFYITAPGVPHFAWAETDVIIQEMGTGPVSEPIEYMNAADDPRKK